MVPERGVHVVQVDGVFLMPLLVLPAIPLRPRSRSETDPPKKDTVKASPESIRGNTGRIRSKERLRTAPSKTFITKHMIRRVRVTVRTV